MNEIIHTILRARVLQSLGFLFVCYLTYDFHIMYLEGFAGWAQWQHAGAAVYMGGLVGTMKLFYEHVRSPIEKDHD